MKYECKKKRAARCASIREAAAEKNNTDWGFGLGKLLNIVRSKVFHLE